MQDLRKDVISVSGGATSGTQEDFLAHATPAARKLLKATKNTEAVLGTELFAAAQAYDLHAKKEGALASSPETKKLLDRIRQTLPLYKDDRPLADAMNQAIDIVRNTKPE